MSNATGLLRTMLRIRRLEEAVIRLAHDSSRPVHGHVHVYIGQEAAGVGALAALGPGDTVFTTHRNHGHVLARGGDPMRILAEILGRTDGYSGGRAGGFHVAVPQLGILHTSAIVGGSIPLAAGAGLAAQRTGTSDVALVFFGDGAMEEGVFSETLNMAQLWNLPVIFYMENNSVSPEERGGRGSPTSEHSASALSDVPRSYGMRTEVIDGTAVKTTYGATRRAVEEARAGNGPTFIESRTSRWPGTYGSHPTLDQTGETDVAWTWDSATAPEVVRRWVETSDPVLIAARDLIAEGDLTRDALLALDAEIQQEMKTARAAAQASPPPDPASAPALVLAPALS
ncbi:MAG: thiamine pyrophosphate-dependent dehydrogenase E1 component subunit alpha [Chloroflexota bacterium]